MYHPHLFARRAELLALRDLAKTLPISGTISPIFEPVKSDEKDLRKAIQELGDANVTASVILNPTVGDFRNAGAVQSWRKSLEPDFKKYKTILPAYVCRPNSTEQNVEAFLKDFAHNNVCLLYWSPKISDAAITKFAKVAKVRFHINLHDQMSVARRALLPENKAVDVRDHFTKCERNADYGGPEFFSDDHLNYSVNSIGFGDYSVVGAQFVAGGGQAHAVAIHALYKSEGDALWIEHFVSDDVDLDVGTVEGKYLQAADKLGLAVKKRPDEFGADKALLGFADDVANHTFPGLAVSKRRQIYHHLALVHSLIS